MQVFENSEGFAFHKAYHSSYSIYPNKHTGCIFLQGFLLIFENSVVPDQQASSEAS